jgi:hypothetical protein
VNVAAWDSIFTDAKANTITDLLRASHLRLVRYPGGSWADEYDWTTDTDSSKCTGPVTARCIESDPLAFDTLSAQARSAGAATFVTVNYGSGTPGEAAKWVAAASGSKDHAVELWEVGNESYSCYETNDHLAGSPTFVKGYVPDGPICPATAVMAKSYSVNAVSYFAAMKKANSDAKIGLPWAFSGNEAKGAGVRDASTWNNMVLDALGGDINFVDAHWYPFDTTAGISNQQILSSVLRIPSAAASIRSAMHRYSPGSGFVVGETNISDRMDALDFEPVSALFAAATSLEWLTEGAESVDWWDLNNFGSPSTGDYGLVSSGSHEPRPAGTQFPPYYGEELASRLTATGSYLEPASTGSTALIGFQSTLHGRRDVLVVNTSSSRSASVSPSWFTTGSELRIETYSAATAGKPDPITVTAASASNRVSLPPLSIVVLSGTPRS